MFITLDFFQYFNDFFSRQGCDAHSNEYIVRLKDEIQICAIIEKLQKYLEKNGSPSDICRVYLRKIEHIYYKYDKVSAAQVHSVSCFLLVI